MSEERRPSRSADLRTVAVRAVVDAVARERSAALGRPLHVLDLGGGSGGMAVPLAVAGHRVTVVDPSPDALASLRRRATEAGVADSVRAVQGDADGLDAALGGTRPDLVCCHGTLEHVEHPAATLRRLGDVLAPGGILSLVTANRLAAVLSRALGGHFAQAQAVLTSPDARWGPSDPLPRRFDRDALVRLAEGAGLAVVDVHPVRLFTDLVPSSLLDSEADRAALLSLEEVAAGHPGLAALGSAVHLLARRG